MKLSDKQIRTISVLVSGGTCLAVAQEDSVSPQIICEWQWRLAFFAEIKRLPSIYKCLAANVKQNSGNSGRG